MRSTRQGMPRILSLVLFFHLSATLLGAQSSTGLERGIRLFEQRSYEQARPVFETVMRAEPANARAAYYLARTFRAEGNVDRAIEWFERAVRLEETNSTYHAELAGAYGQKAVRANRARQALLAGRIRSHLERAVALDPSHLEARFGLVQFYVMAPGMMGGSKQKAHAEATEIRRRNAYVGARALALVHESERNYAAAESEYRAAIAQYPDSTALYYGLGAVYVQMQQYDRAYDVAEGLLRRRPNDRGVLYQIGRIGALSGQRLERAEQALLQYLQHRPAENQPPLAAAHWRLGMVYEKKDQKELARQQYNTALRLDPQNREAREALRKLE